MPKAKASKSTPKGKITSIEAYLATQPEEARPILAKVVGAIQKAVPKAVPTIAYQMPTWKLNGTALLHLGGWKSHWSLYPASAAVIDAIGEPKGAFEVEKGTLRFPLKATVPVGLITKVAKARAAELTAPSTEKNLLKRTTTGGKKAGAEKKTGATKKAGAKKDAPLPNTVGRPALRALEAAGITTLAEAARRNPMDLAKLHGVGPKALGILAEAISPRRTKA
ncbi:MAG: DUF1801 domain-containing protein [Deltaproteobacteria bacterium]|jgi:uncharacterized protein YdhG (YjbR/CyaY superfamily)|nr:DUF1801 domain-containing protein [Deltaproteobacteria bacterium]